LDNLLSKLILILTKIFLFYINYLILSI